MAKFYGKIGYTFPKETAPGVWSGMDIIEKEYSGDVTKNTKRYESGESVNDNIVVSNTISIVSDAYADQHFFAMQYVEWMGALWKISKVEVLRPRLILTIGEVYNGPTAGTA